MKAKELKNLLDLLSEEELENTDIKCGADEIDYIEDSYYPTIVLHIKNSSGKVTSNDPYIIIA